MANRTLGAPTNQKPGQTGVIQIWNGSGVGTLGFSTAWKFAGAGVPQLTGINGRRDLLFYECLPSGEVFGSLIKDVR